MLSIRSLPASSRNTTRPRDGGENRVRSAGVRAAPEKARPDHQDGSPRSEQRRARRHRREPMRTLVRAIRDADGVVLGEAIFDIADREARSKALAALLTKVYEEAP